MTLLEVKALKKTYTTRLGGHLVPALTNVTFSVEKGETLPSHAPGFFQYPFPPEEPDLQLSLIHILSYV